MFDELFGINPRIQYYPGYDTKGEYDGLDLSGIKAISFDSVDYEGRKTKVFAHIGYPENITSPVPAVVLVPGGMCHPEDVWVKKWNNRGYAAIVIDASGFFPKMPFPHFREGSKEVFIEQKLNCDFFEEGYTVGPKNSEMDDMNKPLCDQWMYHAVSALILAHNILLNDEKIDSEKIGISGISWGGVITSVAIGYDTRFAFAVPVYSSGYLGSGLSGICRQFKAPGVQKWYAEKRFENVKMPVMWLCWNDDACFSINSNSMSYLDTMSNNDNTCLSMKHDMQHSHYHGYTPKESYWFADMVLGGKKIPSVKTEYENGFVNYSCSEKIKSAKLFYITERMTYCQRKKYGYEGTFMEQEWNIIDLDTDVNVAKLPENVVGRYVEFTLENDIVLTTPYFEIQ